MRGYLKEPFWQAVLVLLVSYALLEWGITYIPPLLGFSSAPVPQSVVVQFMLTIALGVLLWVSEKEERWGAFKRPIREVMVLPERRKSRAALLILLPALVGFITYDMVRPTAAAPAGIRAVHPAPPTTIDFQGEMLRIDGAENPLRQEGRIEEAYEIGYDIYYRDCMPCHGDYLAGDGPLAEALSPRPLPLRGTGTISELTESYVFWRIAKGGPGLPREGQPWNSAMPAWEDFLTEEEIWAVTLFLYEQAGISPRTWEEF